MPRKPKSEYDKLVAMGLIHGRKDKPPMTEDERKQRRAAQTRLMMEARRRAQRVLVQVYKDEFDDLYRQEKEALQLDPHYAVPER